MPFDKLLPPFTDAAIGVLSETEGVNSSGAGAPVPNIPSLFGVISLDVQ